MVMDGEVMALNTNTNHTYNEFASFFLDEDNNPFFEYIRQTVRFYNNDHRNVNVAAFNVIGNDLRFPVILDRQIMSNTQTLRDRFPGVRKIVVSGDEIVEITHRGVDIPEDGYVLVIPYEMREYLMHYFNVGDSARLRFTNNIGIDFESLQMAIGGGAMILSERETVYGAGIQPNARHPRSAIGVTRDGDTMILMVVDGRNHSIGATQNEMASLMRAFGAWDAMHFDGGGSSTLVARDWDGRYSVINTPSDGGQRRIINALGVFDSRSLTEIRAQRPPISEFTLAELRGNPAEISLLSPGSYIQLRIAGVTTEGVYIPNVSRSNVSEYRVSPPELGTVDEHGVFTASNNGAGYVAITAHGLTVGIPITVGGNGQNTYFHRSTLGFLGYPSAYSLGSIEQEGRNITLNYRFRRTEATQSANLTIYPPQRLPRNTTGLNLRVTGNGSGHWLRGRVRDASGRTHLIDFTQSIDFTTRETVTATLPPEAPGPFTIDRIYAVSMGTEVSTDFTLHFGALEAVVAPTPPTDIPRSPTFRDPMWDGTSFRGDGPRMRFDLPERNEAQYSHKRDGRFTAVTMSLYGGRLGNDQWRWFFNDIMSNNTNYVVILLDNNPLTSFRQAAEFDLFHMAMRDLTDEGRQVFVVSATASNTGVTIRDGIRYINMARSREYIRFRTYGENIFWAG